MEQSENKIAQAEANYLAEQQNLMLKVSQAYFSVLAATSDLNFILAEKKATEQQYEKAQALFKEGWIASFSVYEAQAALDKAKANQISAENTLHDAIAKLVELTGGNDSVTLNDLYQDITPTPPEPADLSLWIIRRRKKTVY